MMISLIVSIFTVVAFAGPKAEKINRAELKRQIVSGCMEMSKATATDKARLICNCIVENFDKKATDHQLKLLAENYTGKSSEPEDKEIPSSSVQNFDYEVATECSKDPNWRIKD